MQHFVLVETADGSPSLCDEETGEWHHNRAGAFTEARANFVLPCQAVARLQRTGMVRVIDACFGMGYNSWVLLAEASRSGVCGRIEILGVEVDPGVLSMSVKSLAYPPLAEVALALGWTEAGAVKPEWGQTAFSLHSGCAVELTLLCGDLREIVPGLSGAFDVVFHDAFSPARRPELWTVDLFRQYHRLLSAASGRLVTYSSATAVRGGLEDAGFKVWRTEAVGGKSGGTLAVIADEQEPDFPGRQLYAEERARLATRSRVPYRDPSLRDSRETILQRRRQEQGAFRTAPPAQSS